MSDEEETQPTDDQKIEIAKWFLLNAPAGEIQYIAKGNLRSMLMHVYIRITILLFDQFRIQLYCADMKAVLQDETLYTTAAAVAFPLYNKSHMICLDFPDRSGEVTPIVRSICPNYVVSLYFLSLVLLLLSLCSVGYIFRDFILNQCISALHKWRGFDMN